MLKKSVIILVVTVFALMASGCASQETAYIEENINIMDDAIETNASVENSESSVKLETSESTQTSETVGDPELRIMSTSITDNVVHIRVINSGDDTANDVYCGVIGVTYNWNFRPEDFPNRAQIFETVAYEALTNASSSYNVGLVDYKNPYQQVYDGQTIQKELIVEGKLIHQYYVGDLNPSEIKEADMTLSTYYDYIKIAWTEDKEIFAIY